MGSGGRPGLAAVDHAVSSVARASRFATVRRVEMENPFNSLFEIRP